MSIPFENFRILKPLTKSVPFSKSEIVIMPVKSPHSNVDTLAKVALTALKLQPITNEIVNTPGNIPNRVGGAVRKRTRQRLCFAQQKVLQDQYAQSQFVDRSTRDRLQRDTGMTTKAVMTWFQNKRQMSKKKGEESAEDL
jgi:hypothetical protein